MATNCCLSLFSLLLKVESFRNLLQLSSKRASWRNRAGSERPKKETDLSRSLAERKSWYLSSIH